ncbi:ARL14 effector protein isoform X2 [Lampris incognitus]|uniref:ARL14 effector protein isoform X2 n=1 Tax=Lampris incognitus TaxID=2546036 RepID=UPI0024B59247|nr:ARL14 effector protein isoform X2 [Lampris incognitus]
MPVICAATGCTNKFIKGSDIRFYRFPISKPQLANQWVHSLGLKNFIPTTNTCLCSEHFRPDCFRDYNGKQFLREDAVPTIFASAQDSSKLQIELRKRGVIPKDMNPANRFGTQAEKDRAKEAAASQRKDKKGMIRGGRGGARGGKSMTSDRQSFGAKSKVYDSKGQLLSNGKDMCDCLDIDCMGCFYPCPECGSRKCGVECRCDRKWLYEQVEVEGGEIIRNKYAEVGTSHSWIHQ